LLHRDRLAGALRGHPVGAACLASANYCRVATPDAETVHDPDRRTLDPATEPKPPTCVVAQVKGLTGTAAKRLLNKHRWRVGTVNPAKANARAAASDLDPTARQTQRPASPS
jgi:hypothetical protein